MPKTVRLYHFVPDAHGLSNVRYGRLKIAFADQVNDLFELRPFDFGEGHAGRVRRKIWDSAIAEHATKQGFVSFSEDWSVPTMWAHYADNHKGLCLGFDIRLDIPEKPEKIQYVEALKRLDDRIATDAQYNSEMVEYARTTKSAHWSFEKEWRCWCSLSQSEKTRKERAPTDLFFLEFSKNITLREIIIGYRSSASSRELRELLSGRNEVSISTARPSFREFGMVHQRRKDLQK